MIPIRYLAADPRVNHPADWEEPATVGIVTFGLPGALLLCSAVFGWTVWRQRQLLTHGLPAPGVVTKCYRVKSGWIARYQFRTPDGAIATGSGPSTRDLAIGTVVALVYDPRKPSNNRSYPMDSYRVG
jgi:hypothetical protein